MTISGVLRLLSLVSFIVAALLAFAIFTISGAAAVPLGWVAVGLALWVASTFSRAGRTL